MPESFIAALILIPIVIGVLIYAIGKKATTTADLSNKRDARFVAAILVVVIALLTVNASFNTVDLRHAGIVTEFHTTTGEVTGSGVHWVKPWDKIEEWDANYELWDHTADNDGKGMKVKISGNQDAYVPVSVEFAPDPANASKDFKDYARNRDNWINRRVNPTLNNIVTNLFREHDPLAKANVNPTTGQVNPPDMGPYKAALLQQLQGAGTEFQIRNLNIGTITYNDKTAEALQAYANLVLQNRNLEQEKNNQTLKNQITEKQSQVDKQTYCLQIADKNGGQPGLCLASGSGVIVDATKK